MQLELFTKKNIWQQLRLCPWLLFYIFLLSSFGLIILYSASGQSQSMMIKQLARLGLSFCLMVIFAQIPAYRFKHWSVGTYLLGLGLLVAVMLAGKIGKGAQRWLDLGILRFQPSELMKLIVPMMLAWFFSKQNLPTNYRSFFIAGVLLIIPCAMIAKQPDLGTAIMVLLSGSAVIFFAGLRYRLLIGLLAISLISMPLTWHFLHDYQRHRILTFIHPEIDPLGKGYHIIQSKIAIGSGGVFGKGWLNGTQSNLHFLPEHTTDFIFAVCGEEFGFIGNTLLLFIILLIVFRMLYMSYHSKNTYTQLLGIGISINFFLSAFVNIGMVSGLLPVVGVPLPLVSYGGSSMLMLFAGFGMVMSFYQDKQIFIRNNDARFWSLIKRS